MFSSRTWAWPPCWAYDLNKQTLIPRRLITIGPMSSKEKLFANVLTGDDDGVSSYPKSYLSAFVSRELKPLGKFDECTTKDPNVKWN